MPQVPNMPNACVNYLLGCVPNWFFWASLKQLVLRRAMGTATDITITPFATMTMGTVASDLLIARIVPESSVSALPLD